MKRLSLVPSFILIFALHFSPLFRRGAGGEAFSQSPQKPFPQHFQYTQGSILPNNHTQAQLDADVKIFYDAWKAVYLKPDCGNNQYYVWFQENPPSSKICVSEGQGYGMLITALMAGYDTSAKTYFDGLYHFYKAHPSVNNSYLMAWSQVAGCIDDPNGGNDGATDGDMDIAYALLLAHNQWGSNGNINYLIEAQNIINAIKQNDINHQIWTAKLGDWADSSNSMFYDTRPSDFMMDHFRAFENATGDAAWTNVITTCYNLIDSMQTNYSQASGLLPDFIIHCNTAPVPASANYLEGPDDGHFSYNACRTPWRICTDYLVSGDSRAKIAIDKMNAWIRTKTSNTPANIQAGYKLDGYNISGNNYASEAFIGPFAVAAMDSSINQTWLNNTYDELLSLQLQNTTYYENTIKMLNLIVLSSNWWIPTNFTTNVNDISKTSEHIVLMPNPSRDKLFISNSNKQILSIECVNTLGQQQHLQLINNVMDVADLKSGVYTITLLFEHQEKIIRKFVKQ